MLSLLRIIDLADIVGGVGIILLFIGGYLIAGWPIFLVGLGVVLVIISIVLGSNSAQKDGQNGESGG